MQIKIEIYPVSITFQTEQELPPFKYGCKVRTKIAQAKIAKEIFKAQHGAEDFIVERITKTKDGEIWDMGS